MKKKGNKKLAKYIAILLHVAASNKAVQYPK